MATETMASHVLAAKYFKNNLPNLWYCMARPQPWSNEEVPPAEDIYTTALDTPIGYKRWESSQLVVPAKEGEPINEAICSYRGHSWLAVPDSEAFKRYARWVYLSVWVYPDELPYNIFRQIGIYQDLKPLPSYVGNDILVPAYVEDPGILVGYDNRQSQRYTYNVKLHEEIVIEF
ncbi:MAG: hypothetical protein [Caudoviricetes sp.]|nr:MAG: hypothetical protein [Caudoviricetes sp.]